MKQKLLFFHLMILMISVISISGQAQNLAYLNDPDNFSKQKESVSLIRVLSNLETRFQVSFDYDVDMLNDKLVNINQIKETDDLNHYLIAVLKPFKLSYKKYGDNTYLIFREGNAHLKKLKKKKVINKSSGLHNNNDNQGYKKFLVQINSQKGSLNFQARTITGKVTADENGESIPGVNVVEKGTTNGTITNVMGEYTLEVSEGATIVFSSVGFATQEIELNNRSVIDVTMSTDVQQLEEIVIVGYGQQKKQSTVGSIVQASSEVLEKTGGVANLGQALPPFKIRGCREKMIP